MTSSPTPVVRPVHLRRQHGVAWCGDVREPGDTRVEHVTCVACLVAYVAHLRETP